MGRGPIARIDFQRTLEPSATKPAPSSNLLTRTTAS